MSYSALNAGFILATVERLRARVEERFPNRGIAQVCAQLADVARRDSQRVSQLVKPDLAVRAGVLGVATLFAGALFLLVTKVKWPNLLRLLQPGGQDGAILISSRAWTRL